MTTAIEYALMAGAAYISNRDPKNQFPIPQGWLEFAHVPNNPDYPMFTGASGFEAVSFQNIANPNEIVISFAGTDFSQVLSDWTLLGNDFWQGNIPLVTGTSINGADQLVDAVEYYLQVKASVPAGTTITLTGHSLGGSLAALVGVFFGETAFTFDQVPAAATAMFAPATLLRDALLARGHTEAELAPLQAYIAAADPLNIDPIAADTLAAREASVTNLNVQGEVASLIPLASRIGSEASIGNESPGVGSSDLHSIALLTTFLQSNQTADPNKSLSDVTYKLTDLLKMIFDDKLFYHDPLNLQPNAPENFLERLVKHEAGVQGTITADAMVTRFNSDLWKIAQDGGLTMTDWALTGMGVPNNVGKTLIAFAMQKYYEEQAGRAGLGETLFQDVSGGIQFDTAAVVGEGNSITGAKGYTQYFQQFLTQTAPDLGAGANQFTSAERQLIRSLLPTLRDWYVQAGASGMNATDTLNRGAFMLGGNGSDALVGGTGADLLVGNAGADLLQGGLGNDFLLGGTGNDAYVYTSGDGFDTILDAGGQGSIAMDGAILAGGAQYGDDRVHRDTSGHLYVNAGQSLIIDSNLLVLNYSSGNLGLTLSGPVADINPVTTRDIYGDLASDGTPDDLGNPDGAAAPGRADTLFDSAGKDLIMSYGGDDLIYADKGEDDIIEAGTGRDKVLDFGGNDVIMGNADGDILWGGTGNDRIYADIQIDVATAIANGNGQTGTGLQGDWLAGGLGDDTLIGATDNDVLSGGNGKDLLIGGAGDDDILGDVDWVAGIFEWTVTDQPDGTRFFDGVEDEQLPAVGATDVIYAGEGNDHAWGGFGNDVIFGEGGGDILYGEEGNDILLGGSDSDKLWGGTENDYLDGGDGADQIIGGTGDDILIGGKGIDTLWGEAGRDIYIFNRGDGGDTVYDTQADNNIFRFGAGINSSDITLNLGSLKLNLGNGDEIHIANFDRNDVFNSSSIGSLGGNDRMLGAANDAGYGNSLGRKAA